MTTLINNQWEKFCLATFNGKNCTEAAKEAGYSPKTAYSIGSRLLKKVEIATRVKELHEKAASPKIMSVTQRKERLTEIAASGKEPVRAIAELNKMEGEYAPQKVDFSSAGKPLELIVRWDGNRNETGNTPETPTSTPG
ncbi:MAG: terminase small subunit [Chloroflexota bacterium]